MLLPFPAQIKVKHKKCSLISVTYEIVILHKKKQLYLFFMLFLVNTLL